MHTTNRCALTLALLNTLILATLSRGWTPAQGDAVLPLSSHPRSKRGGGSRDVAGTVGLGDSHDFVYFVAVTVGNSTVTLNLDTGSSDLWVISNNCESQTCQDSSATRYNIGDAFDEIGNVDLQFGDSQTRTHAAGPVGRDTVTLAALTMPDQPFAAVDDTDNSAVSDRGAGILGLGFFPQSFVQDAAVDGMFGGPLGSDTFVEKTQDFGPIVTRLALSGKIHESMFAITLQRNEIDVSGTGQLTIGQLPPGIDNASITWVPVRLYDSSVGGLDPPSFAPNEIYPLRWEIGLDAIFLDGKKLPDTQEQANGIQQPTLSALIDTGNSLIRGPQDVVANIMSKVSPAFAADSSALPTLPCDAAHSLAFQIGGVLFPVDPRDFISQNTAGDATTCVADNVVGTDPPSFGALFSWNLGDAFLKSNLAVFYYGNVTHPSVDPPRIGLLSLVPENAGDLLSQAVSRAQQNGGSFESTTHATPTSSSFIEPNETAQKSIAGHTIFESSSPRPTRISVDAARSAMRNALKQINDQSSTSISTNPLLQALLRGL